MKAILGFQLLAYATAYSIQGNKGSTSAPFVSPLSRRSFGSNVVSALSGCGVLLQVEPAVAKSDQEDIDKQNILKGYVSP